MGQKVRMGAAFVWTLATAMISCGGDAANDTLELGAIMSVSGNKAQPGQGELQSIQLAIDEINTAGGVNGKRLVLVNRNDKSDSDGARAAAADLVTNARVSAVLGTTAPETTVAAAGVTIPAGVVLISDIASGPSLNDLVDQDTVFTTAPDRAVQGRQLAVRARAKGFSKAAVLYVDLPLHTETAMGFVSAFTSMGGTVTVNAKIDQGRTSYTDVLQQAYAAGTPDCLLLNAEAPDGVQFMKDYLSTYSAKQTFFFYNPALGNPDFFEGVGYENFTFGHEGIDVADGPGIDAYQNAFMARYPGTTVEFEPGIYDDVYLLALAMEAAGKTDADSIKTHLRAINDPAGTKVGPGEFAKAAALLQSGAKVNYEGASGPCDFDQKGAAQATSLIWVIKDDAATGKRTQQVIVESLPD
jgi:branched-chain amino acid transport system substrate-binding protein